MKQLSNQISYKFTFTVQIIIIGTVTKKNTVRDAVVQQLQNAKNAGNIESAKWDIASEIAPEGGSV